MLGKRVPLLTATILLVSTTSLMAQEGTQDTMSWFQMFFVSSDPIGMTIIAILLLGSVFVLAFSTQMALKYRQVTLLPPQTEKRVQKMIDAKQYRQAIEFVKSDRSYLGKLVSSALGEAANGYDAMERAIEETGDAETTRILRPIEYLNVVGNIAPMMGLFGTVYGMIRAFQALVEAGGKPDPALLAGGISTALVTTFWGLIVAIPALAAYAIIRNRVDALTAEAMLRAEALIRPFKPGGKKKPRPDSPNPQPERNDT